MFTPKINQRIRVNRQGQGYEFGKFYNVVRIDNSDSTLIAKDSNGQDGQWIRWNLCTPVGTDISWEWLKTQIPGEVLEFLSTFDGLDHLRLKDEVRDHILLQLPNLKTRILEAQITIDEGAPQPVSIVKNDEDQDPDELFG